MNAPDLGPLAPMFQHLIDEADRIKAGLDAAEVRLNAVRDRLDALSEKISA